MYKYLVGWTAKRQGDSITFIGSQSVSRPIPFRNEEDVKECERDLKKHLEDNYKCEFENVCITAFSKYEEGEK